MDDELSCHVRVPRERIAVVIGKDGETKKEIEEATKTKLHVNTEEGIVFAKADDALNLFTVQEVIKAIARGFNPRKALILIKTDYAFQLIDLQDFAGKQHFERIKGRIIGHEGKARENIESLTDTFISVFGKTIAIIGRSENVDTCRRAIVNLINGSPHSAVYKWLEKKHSEIKAMEMIQKRFPEDEFGKHESA